MIVHDSHTRSAAADPGPSTILRSRLEGLLQSRLWQVAGIVVTFLLIAALHASNDGLWFQGDSARHGANGFFWRDLLAMLPVDPAAFALRYYARYPVIAPLSYPPLFYLFEGLAFTVIGPSPYAAKLVVLAFAAVAGLYTMAWARRWLGPWAGWTGAFLAFVPGVVLWTNAVMLNLPATALGLACIYHFRRWIESGAKKQLGLSALSAAAVLTTYYAGIIVLGVALTWALFLRRKKRFAWRSFFAIAAAVIIGFVPLALSMKLVPVLAARNLPAINVYTVAAGVTFYCKALAGLLGLGLLALGLAGIVMGLRLAPWRREVAFLSTWIAALILCVSLLPARDPRYILLAAPAFVLAAAIGLHVFLQRWPAVRPPWQAAMLLTGLGAGFCSAALVRVPKTEGFREVAAYLQRYAPDEPVLYDGYHDGVFGFYARALDPRFERRIVLADKLLYHYGPTTNFFWVETSKVASTADIVNVLRTESGCRWVAIEVGHKSEWAQAQRLLRQTVARSEFQLVRSFPIRSNGAQRVNLYRMNIPVARVPTVDLTFPSYSARTYMHVVPITR